MVALFKDAFFIDDRYTKIKVPKASRLSISITIPYQKLGRPIACSTTKILKEKRHYGALKLAPVRPRVNVPWLRQ